MLYHGNTLIDEVYHGSTKIGEIYHGSTLVYQSKYPSGTIVFESNTPGTYTIIVRSKQTFHIDLVGGGGGSVTTPYIGWINGGSAAYIYGDILLDRGTYTLQVGKGGQPNTAATSEQNSIFLENIAGGGSGAYGGTATVVTSGLTGQNGSNASATGWINGYGGGGSNGSVGKDGYCKIVAV